ncbi:MAG: ATP-binding cassette domain-containing protein [Saprospiraceae bacterium]
MPTVKDILKGREEHWFDDTNIVNSTEQDRKCSELQQLPRLIGIRNLDVRYPRSNGWFFQKKNWHYAVKDVSLDIFQGEVVGLVGESGSGKTSLGRAILGLAPVSSGEIYYRDQRLDGLSSSEWRLLRKNCKLFFRTPTLRSILEEQSLTVFLNL